MQESQLINPKHVGGGGLLGSHNLVYLPPIFFLVFILHETLVL